jgi:hypothetical protein
MTEIIQRLRARAAPEGQITQMAEELCAEAASYIEELELRLLGAETLLLDQYKRIGEFEAAIANICTSYEVKYAQLESQKQELDEKYTIASELRLKYEAVLREAAKGCWHRPDSQFPCCLARQALKLPTG